MDASIDTLNRWLVTSQDGRVLIFARLSCPRPTGIDDAGVNFDRQEALALAAQIVAMAETLEPADAAPTFAEILAAVRAR